MLAFIEYLAADLPPLISSASAAFLSLSVPSGFASVGKASG